ncbi:major facilitator superfamily MFS_1 [Mycolicibacterium canariasense]|uniref:Major facilitator superfamily MFS_1 n=1 Tax=Mycolicibacterium canariasense TaxID=228230 RepID=A0A100WER4_MYCCR|nr:major facilitator superfamily MFS_1 [Mycolicibacterium canariasense]
MVTAALMGIPVGRWLDRHGPHGIMTAGSVLAVVALLAVAAAPTYPMFVAAWIAAGVAMSAVFYAPAFAALTRYFAPDAVRALTLLTLVAGLASTVFAPLTATLASQMSWRSTYLVLAAILAVVTIPGHLLGLRREWPAITHAHDVETPTRIARSRAFVALTVAFALAALASYAVIVNLVPLMTERGFSTGAAAVALGVGGAGQVLGRLGYHRLVERFGVVTRTVVVMAAVALTTALLGAVTSLAALVAMAVVAGVVRGIMTLLQATAVTERWGAAHYGHLSGILSAPVMVTTALGPFVGAVLASCLHSYATMFIVLGLAAAVAAALAAATAPHGDAAAVDHTSANMGTRR